MTVEAYQREFLNLSCYAEDEITIDDRKQQKFRRGLQSDLRLALSLHDFASFATLVNKAITFETAQLEHKDSQKRSRDVGSSSGSTPKRRVWLPYSVYQLFAPASRPSYVAPRLPPPPPRQPRFLPPQSNAAPLRPQDGLCLKCRLPGHMARDCPRV